MTTGDDEATARLSGLLLELIAMPCVTGDEDRIATWLVDRYVARDLPVRRIGNSVVAGEHDDRRPTVLLVAHSDVVPPTPGDLPGRREGDRIVGRGASDMKAGLAVAMDLLEDATLRNGPVALRLVAYAGEEGPHEGNELAGVLEAMPDLTRAAVAVVLEPTDLQVQLGCTGGLHAHVRVPGRAAHSARPWQGHNALTAAAPLLARLGALEPVERTVDGLAYRDVVTATRAWTDNAHNVVPDRFTVNVNFRFAPDRDLATAEQEFVRTLHRLADADADAEVEIAVVDRAPPAPPRADHPLIRTLVAAAGDQVAAKQAWTDVARLAAVGLPAVNYGPGLTAQAHQAGEYVPVANLGQSRAVLRRWLASLSNIASGISTSDTSTEESRDGARGSNTV